MRKCMSNQTLNLKDLCVNELCIIHNSLLRQSTEYEKHRAKHEMNRIKNKLISMGQLSNYVLDYEGKL